MFAKRVFQIAGWLGFIELIPLLFVAKNNPIAAQPVIYYGFLAVTLSWQVVFLLIATDPARYRLMMIPAMLEKGLYVTVVAAVAATTSKLAQSTLLLTSIDLIWLVLFAVSYAKTPHAKSH